MDLQIALLLGQDGITNGAIYALLALALVLLFAVTRVIFVPQGEFVTYGTLTLAAFQAGKLPATVWLVIGVGMVISALDGPRAWRQGGGRRLAAVLGWNIGLPVAVALISAVAAAAKTPLAVQVLLTVAIIVPLGPMLYRLAFQPIADAPVLVLLIVAVALHLALVGLGLLFFGAEGSRTPAFSSAVFELGGLRVNGQTLWVLASSAILIVALYQFFARSLYGKALRATASNRVGARLMGISPTLAGRLSFLLAALIGAFSGILIGPITTIYYDTGFLVGLKGFVGAIIGGMVSYPLAAVGALLVGFLEAYSSFWASAFKEVIVFTLIIPVLLWRSLSSHSVGEDEE